MISSGILDVTIAIIFLYLLLSLFCSSLTEGIARILALRSSNLKEGLRNLLTDPQSNIVKELYNHPLMKGLYHQGWFEKLTGRDGGPSYIPSRTFARALFDIIMPPNERGKLKTFAEVRDAVNEIQNEDLRRVLLLSLNDANGRLDKARESVESWFNDAMERVSGWYKRKVQVIILLVALVVSVALNADTFNVASSLWNDTALRESVVAAAQRATEQPLSEDIGEIRQQITDFQLPLGWQGWQSLPATPVEWLAKGFGLLFTAAALSLGAPFWFDVLNKVMRIRSSGESPATSER
jgi:hypothetical protein